jgi:pyrimidine deaminase RibD-like protein
VPAKGHYGQRVTTDSNADPRDLDWMRQAVDLGKQSIAERRGPLPRVGAVAVRGGVLVAEGFRGKTGKGDHAEYGLIRDSDAALLVGATLYTTLEPCSRRGPKKRPCAQRVVDAGFSTVVIGIYDPNPAIYREGWRILRDSGVRLRDFSADLRSEVEKDNTEFRDSYRYTVGGRGSATFDFTQNGGKFEVRSTDGSFATGWTARGQASIYAIDHQCHVAHVKYAKNFEEVDDPGALDFSNYTVPLQVGDVGVFRNETGHLLVRVAKVIHNDGGENSLSFDFEVRGPSS